MEKLDDWQDRGLQELLREAQKVYVRRDEEKQKAKAKIFVAAVRETQKREQPRSIPKVSGPGYREGKETEQKEEARTLSREVLECYYCGKKRTP